MASPFVFPENLKPVTAIQPRTTDGGLSATQTNYISVKNANKVYLYVALNQSVGHATAITLRRATGVGKCGVAPVGDAALANDVKIWLNEDTATDDLLVEQTDGKSCTVTGDVKDKQIVFAIDPATLGGSYDVIGFTCNDSSQATNHISATWLIEPKYASRVATAPSVEDD